MTQVRQRKFYLKKNKDKQGLREKTLKKILKANLNQDKLTSSVENSVEFSEMMTDSFLTEVVSEKNQKSLRFLNTNIYIHIFH